MWKACSLPRPFSSLPCWGFIHFFPQLKTQHFSFFWQSLSLVQRSLSVCSHSSLNLGHLPREETVFQPSDSGGQGSLSSSLLALKEASSLLMFLMLPPLTSKTRPTLPHTPSSLHPCYPDPLEQKFSSLDISVRQSPVGHGNCPVLCGTFSSHLGFMY